ncbi:MAG TPA: IclR family transcriptional regulator [Cryomorphaceae bacterium]|nr:IclR family transcriptional regulator [Owenweeksia sp.]MBF97495.1 IclR family transcriptional regulator [Owenweeksia sp.]HAD95912.1 IclR family transcriptional regulator [Cryomorphaceae bacterium]HBF19997.1 IclR family transcriptional regulator [Cryomorphaceae bacterium]HCQ14985.1 IclR family transcriptional regulator [Cryomorphaceae bacterium]
MEHLLSEIRNCTVCAPFLEHGPRPVLNASRKSKILVIGQAPGTRVHKTGIPWNDPSGKTLRQWMNISDADFYDPQQVGIVPMGFCYPGKGRSGDLPPRKECAPLWHKKLLDQMPDLKLTLLIGQYAQAYYLAGENQKTLTDTVRSHKKYAPHYFPLPHPSPRNRIWLKRNPWFEAEVIPLLQQKIAEALI